LLLVLIGFGVALVAGIAIFGAIALTIGWSQIGGGDGTPNPAAFLLTLLFILVIYACVLVLSIFLSTRLGLAQYAAATDHLSPGQAIGQSWKCTRGNWWRTFLPLFVVGLCTGVVVAVATQVFEYISLAATFLVAIPLMTALTTPLAVVTAMVIYYDLRLRKEGFPALAHQLGLWGQTDTPGGSR
jgi:hypothetical protein